MQVQRKTEMEAHEKAASTLAEEIRKRDAALRKGKVRPGAFLRKHPVCYRCVAEP
jgi:hypothetical protein